MKPAVIGVEVDVDVVVAARRRNADRAETFLLPAGRLAQPANDGAQVDGVELPLDLTRVHRCHVAPRSIVGLGLELLASLEVCRVLGLGDLGPA